MGICFCCCKRKKSRREQSRSNDSGNGVHCSERESLKNRESSKTEYSSQYSQDNHYNQSTSENSNPLIHYNWYYGFISRLNAHELLRNEENGTFLVRSSNDAKNEYPYIISVKHKPSDASDHKENYHYRIRKDENGYFTLGWNLYFKTVKDLLDYYKGKTDILKVPLKTFIDQNYPVG